MEPDIICKIKLQKNVTNYLPSITIGGFSISPRLKLKVVVAMEFLEGCALANIATAPLTSEFPGSAPGNNMTQGTKGIVFHFPYQNGTLPLKFDCKFTLQRQIHSYNTRNSHTFCLPFCWTNIKQFSIFYQGPKFYNSLITEIMNSSTPASFKKALKAFIYKNY